MHFPASKQAYLEGKIGVRARERAADSRDYLRRMCAGEWPDELNRLLDEITVNETYFMRDPPQLEAFRRHLAPELAPGGPLRILSAGCSSGEEPYTLAILLHEHLPGRAYAIEAIDISEKSLALAEQGEYGAYAVRHLPEPLRRKCFEPADGRLRLRAPYRAAVRFRRQSLMELRPLPGASRFHIVFCRYVLIYFGAEAKKRAIDSLHGLLAPGGYLVLGGSESLPDAGAAFHLLHFPSAIVYKRRESDEHRHGTGPHPG